MRLSTLYLSSLITTAVLASPTLTSHESNLSQKIKKVVILVMENRSFNNIAGYFNHSPDIDNLIQFQQKNGHPFCNPISVSDPSQGTVCATTNAPNIQTDDPDHGLPGIMYQQFGQLYSDSSNQPEVPSMNGFINDNANTHSGSRNDVNRLQHFIAGSDVTMVPHTFSLAKEFVLFDRWFASVPGPTNPNRAFITSATSNGHGGNDGSFYFGTLPQKSIFQLLSEHNISWKNYDNEGGFPPDAMFYSWVRANKAQNVVPFQQFFDDAASGNLPQFSYINPECCNKDSYHPPSPVSSGEAFVKLIYDTLRSSPSWNDIAFFLTFDEHGGFADHVPSPRAPTPGDGQTFSFNQDGVSGIFRFDRYGVRVPSFLISPHVPKGVVNHDLFDHTSMLKFVETLWGLPALTNRDASANEFSNLFSLDSPRTDCPLYL